ncbi:MAG: hypothetical protein ACOXZZ_05280 [Sphaerochaetaceae bacterium]
MKKKIILTLLIVGLLTSALYADFFDDNQLFDQGTTFKPISARIEAMGGAGIATARNGDAFFFNPANLADGKFSLNLPSVSVTLFNPKKIIDTGIIQKLIEGEEFDPVADGMGILNIFNRGKGDVLTTDIATSFTVGGFGLGLNIQQQLHNIDKGSNVNLFAELSVALSVGLGVRIDLLPNKISLDVGAVARPTYKVYTDGIGAGKVLSLVSDDDDADDPFDAIMKEVALAAGSALPFDIGLNVNFPFGFRVSAVARDINGQFKMQKYEHSGDYINEMMDLFGGDKNTYSGASAEPVEFEAELVPWSLDFGVGWVGSFGRLDKFIRPTFSFDFVDVNNLAKALESDKNAYWNHLRAGVELRLLSTIDLRAGMNRGALSVGVGLDLFAMRVDAAYYWREMGVSIGDRSVDAFTIRFNLGYDR